MMQGDVGVATREPRERRNSEPRERRNWFAAKGGEKKVEPNDIRLDVPDRAQQACGIAQQVHSPDALDVVSLKLRFRGFEFVCKDGQAEQRILLQLTRDVVSVFVQPPLARGERRDQTNFHGPLWLLK